MSATRTKRAVGTPERADRPLRKCITESRFPDVQLVTAGSYQPEVVVDVVRGKIPLWARGTTLNWRFEAEALRRHDDPGALKRRVRRLLRAAISAWGSAAPVRFVESDAEWDFEVAVLKRADCDEDGCTLASAFFPDRGRQRMLILPTMFEYSHVEQVATMVHELGHVFGLRHYFADTDEAKFPSKIFGKHSAFTVMNYGAKSKLTIADREDLARLYEAAWSADPEAALGLPVRLFDAPHATR